MENIPLSYKMTKLPLVIFLFAAIYDTPEISYPLWLHVKCKESMMRKSIEMGEEE